MQPLISLLGTINALFLLSLGIAIPVIEEAEMIIIYKYTLISYYSQPPSLFWTH